MMKVGRIGAMVVLASVLAWTAGAQDKPNKPDKPSKPRRLVGVAGEASPQTQPAATASAPAPAEDGSSEIGELPPAKKKKAGDKLTERNVEISGLSLTGETVIFPGDYSGKLVLIHVWGTWCPHCKEELGAWKRAFRTFGDEPFAMLGIITDANRKGTAEAAQKFVTDSKIGWKQIFDDGPQIAANLGVKSLPYLAICDGDTGEILVRGDELRGRKLQPLLRTLIATKVNQNKAKAGGAAASQPATAPTKP